MQAKNRTITHLILLIVICAVATVSMGIINSAVGVFFTPVSEALGVGRGTFSMHITIQALVGAFATLFVARTFDKFPFKIVMLVNIVLLAASTFFMGFATNVVHFYILGAIRGFAGAFVNMFPLSMIINNWYKKSRGLVTSIVMSFTGVAGAVFSPLFTQLIISIGWNQTYMIVGAIILALGLPIVLFPFKLDPKEQGLLAYGATAHDEEPVKINRNAAATVKPKVDFNFVQVSFIAYSFVAVMFAGMTGIAQYLPGYAQTLEYSATVGATLVTATMIGSIVSKLIIGVIADKSNALVAALTMMTTALIGIILLFIAKPEFLLFGGAFLFGAAYSLGSVATVLLTSHFFGLENYTTVFPKVSVASGVGNALIMSLIGFVYDFTQSYIPVLLANAVVYVLIYGVLFFIQKKTHPRHV